MNNDIFGKYCLFFSNLSLSRLLFVSDTLVLLIVKRKIDIDITHANCSLLFYHMLRDQFKLPLSKS